GSFPAPIPPARQKNDDDSLSGRTPRRPQGKTIVVVFWISLPLKDNGATQGIARIVLEIHSGSMVLYGRLQNPRKARRRADETTSSGPRHYFQPADSNSLKQGAAKVTLKHEAS